jgi:hypothetical protein
VDDRIPARDAHQLIVGEVKGVHRTELEAQVGMLGTGQIDHDRRQVEAEHIEPEVTQVGGDPPRTAAKLGDRSAPCGQHAVGERGEHRPVERQSIKLVAGEIGVANGDGVVGGRGRGQARGGSSHTGRCRSLSAWC